MSGIKKLSENELIEMANNIFSAVKDAYIGINFDLIDIRDEKIAVDIWNSFNCFSLMYDYDYNIRYSLTFDDLIKRNKAVVFKERFGIMFGIVMYATKYKRVDGYYVVKEAICNSDAYDLYRLFVLSNYNKDILYKIIDIQRNLLEKIKKVSKYERLVNVAVLMSVIRKNEKG